MAEAMTALSVAAATVQFVDFSLKVFNTCREIRKSTKYATEANAEIESNVEELQKYQKQLKPFASGQGVSQQDIDTIEAVRQECNDVADQILKILQDLKPKKHRWYKAVAAAWRAHRAEGKIQSLEKHMKTRNARFREALTDVTWKRVSHLLKEQQDFLETKILPEVKDMRTENAAAHSSTHDKLEKQDDLMSKTLVPGVKRMNAENAAAHSATHEKLDQARMTAAQNDFLDRLWFAGMSDRHESIKPPATGTYEWIFMDEGDTSSSSATERELRGKFVRWLVSDEKVFWISGKAGSGKSSLMSFIENHNTFKKGLRQWSQGRPLTVINFFFWRPGAHFQKSIPGLLRSLLHQLLTRKPSAIDEICAKDSSLRFSDWTEERLSGVFNEVLDLYESADECLFLLLDGLDEFEGSYSELLEDILTAELRSNTKICLSSRPVGSLRDRLGSYPSIRLEDLNGQDITKFITRKMAAIDYPYKNHMAKVQRRAQGVFLWAALVSKELIKGYTEEHSPEATLQEILDELPQGLTPLFKRFFSDINEHSCGFLLLVFQLLKSATYDEVNIAVLTACSHHNKFMTIHEFLRQSHKVQQQIESQSKGLLEVVRNPYQKIPSRGWALEDLRTHRSCQTALDDDMIRIWATVAWSRVDWLHRSAYDYIFNSPEAELPKWIREISIAQEISDACMWLFRYGLLLYESDRELRDTRPLQSEVGMLTGLITKQGYGNPSSVYQTLDNLCELLNSSLSEGSWLELDIQANTTCTQGVANSGIAGLSWAFWEMLAYVEFYDYILSRFESVKEGRFAHSVCVFLLPRTVENPNLMKLVLDFLTEQAESQTCNAILQTEKTRKYRYSVPDFPFAVSWLSHGAYFESRVAFHMQCETGPMLRHLKRGSSDEPSGQGHSDTSSAGLVADLITLLDLWQLFGAEIPLGAWGSPFKIHICNSQPFKHISTDYETANGTSLRLLGISKRESDDVNVRRIDNSIVPICVFHSGPVANLVLSRFLRDGAEQRQSMFKGSLVNFLECRQTLFEEIREDAVSQLDGLQKRYLLVLVSICFIDYWEIEDWEELHAYEW